MSGLFLDVVLAWPALTFILDFQHRHYKWGIRRVIVSFLSPISKLNNQQFQQLIICLT